jgi:hypothetical protein
VLNLGNSCIVSTHAGSADAVHAHAAFVGNTHVLDFAPMAAVRVGVRRCTQVRLV